MSYFVKIDGIAGESATLPYLHWIEVESFQLEPAGGNAQPNKVTFTAKIDSSFPKLRLAVVSGKSIPSVTIAGTSNSSQVLITLTDCVISSIQGDGWHAQHIRFTLSCKTVNTQHGHVKAVINKQFSPAHSFFNPHIP